MPRHAAGVTNGMSLLPLGQKRSVDSRITLPLLVKSFTSAASSRDVLFQERGIEKMFPLVPGPLPPGSPKSVIFLCRPMVSVFVVGFLFLPSSTLNMAQCVDWVAHTHARTHASLPHGTYHFTHVAHASLFHDTCTLCSCHVRFTTR